MKFLDQYSIPVQGLKEGTHSYHYDIGADFFAYFDNPDLTMGEISVDIEIEKRLRMFVFTFKLNGSVNVVCDRCLDRFDLYIEDEKVLYVKVGKEWKDESESSVIIPEESGQFNVAQHIYEYILLTLPYKRVHENIESCNQEVIERLNRDSDASEKNDQIDPRLEKLNIFKTNNN